MHRISENIRVRRCPVFGHQIGRASCRERGKISGVAVSLKKKKKKVAQNVSGMGGDGFKVRRSLINGVLDPKKDMEMRRLKPQLSKEEVYLLFFFSSRRRHTRLQGDWSSDVCSSDLLPAARSHARRAIWADS